MHCRRDLDDHKQKLQVAKLKIDQHEIVINENKAQSVQLQQEGGDLVASQQDITIVAGEQHKAMASCSDVKAEFQQADTFQHHTAEAPQVVAPPSK